jgi:hypothetical protein
MQSAKKWGSLLLLIGAVLAARPLAATTLVQMDLSELTQRADRIFRGTVIDVDPGTVTAGGGEIPTVLYRLKVEEALKGAPDITKDGVSVIELQMVGSIKPADPVDDSKRLSPLYDVPRLEMGHDYVLFVTPASAIGLSTTVGLGQGAFTVSSRNKEDFAVNEFSNLGLGLSADGPVPYAELAGKIRGLLSRKGTER